MVKKSPEGDNLPSILKRLYLNLDLLGEMGRKDKPWLKKKSAL
jgi:hypothetical protein